MLRKTAVGERPGTEDFDGKPDGRELRDREYVDLGSVSGAAAGPC
jgi:hypothetical protein